MKKIVFIVSLLIFLSGCFGELSGTEEFQAKVSQPAKISTEGWKSFESDLGYKVSYPPNLLPEKRNLDEEQLWEYIAFLENDQRKIDFKIYEGNFEQNILPFMSEMEFQEKEQITVASQVGVKFTFLNKIAIILPFSDKTLKIVLADLEIEEVFNQMLATLEI